MATRRDPALPIKTPVLPIPKATNMVPLVLCLLLATSLANVIFPQVFYARLNGSMVTLSTKNVEFENLNLNVLTFEPPGATPAMFDHVNSLVKTRNAIPAGYAALVHGHSLLGIDMQGTNFNFGSDRKIQGLNLYACSGTRYPKNAIVALKQPLDSCVPVDVYLLPYDDATKKRVQEKPLAPGYNDYLVVNDPAVVEPAAAFVPLSGQEPELEIAFVPLEQEELKLEDKGVQEEKAWMDYLVHLH